MTQLTKHIEEIRAEWQKLDAVWDEAHAKWRDGIAADFTSHHWQPLDDEVMRYVKVLQETCSEVSMAYHNAL